MKKPKQENVDVQFRTQKEKFDALVKQARYDKKSVSALLAEALDNYLERRSREYHKTDPIPE